MAYSMQKRKGKPCQFYYAGDVSIYLGRQQEEGSPTEKNKLEAFSCSVCPSPGQLYEAENLPFIVQDKEHMRDP